LVFNGLVGFKFRKQTEKIGNQQTCEKEGQEKNGIVQLGCEVLGKVKIDDQAVFGHEKVLILENNQGQEPQNDHPEDDFQLFHFNLQFMAFGFAYWV
jgi:hypothetical protein